MAEVNNLNAPGSCAEPIVQYIKDGIVLANKDQARRLMIRASKYLMMGNILYRRSFTLPYLRLFKAVANCVMREVHEGIYGDHQSG